MKSSHRAWSCEKRRDPKGVCGNLLRGRGTENRGVYLSGEVIGHPREGRCWVVVGPQQVLDSSSRRGREERKRLGMERRYALKFNTLNSGFLHVSHGHLPQVL